MPAMVIAASTTATTTIHVSVNRITLRRSTMSPIAPAGRARTKNGRADAVCVRATYIGPALSDTISQAAPTLCINVPTSETTSAMSKLRKVDDLRGRQRLAEPVIRRNRHAIRLVFPRYQHLLGPSILIAVWKFLDSEAFGRAKISGRQINLYDSKGPKSMPLALDLKLLK